MRFAWLQENSENTVSVEQSLISRLVYVAYNVVWWIPVVLAVVGILDYGTAFWAFFVLTLIRAVANLYRNNFLTPEQAESFPLRSPYLAGRSNRHQLRAGRKLGLTNFPEAGVKGQNSMVIRTIGST